MCFSLLIIPISWLFVFFGTVRLKNVVVWYAVVHNITDISYTDISGSAHLNDEGHSE